MPSNSTRAFHASHDIWLNPFLVAGSVDSAVEALLQRTADGVLAEDRREALADLRDLLSHNAQASCPLKHPL